MLKYVLGVDGGGTKTHYALFDTDGKLRAFVQGGPSNHEVISGGYKGTKQEFQESIGKLLKIAGLTVNDINFSVFGLSGADVRMQHSELGNCVEGLGISRYKICNDGFIGIKGGSQRGYGICSVNGTGTCCAAIDCTGKTLQIGGIGYEFGDEAGSVYIGSMVIRYVYESYYRRKDVVETLMKDMLFEDLGINSYDDMVEAIYEQIGFESHDTKRFAQIAFLAANNGDKAALELLEYIGKQTAKSVIGAYNRLDFSKDDDVDIIMTGSVYAKGENSALIDAFKKSVNQGIDGKGRFIILEAPPVVGAVIYAFEEAGIVIDSLLRESVVNSLKLYV